MKHLTSLPCLAAGLVWLATVTPAVQAAQSAGQHSEPIPMAELGAKAGAQYQGDGLSVAPTPEGALRVSEAGRAGHARRIVAGLDRGAAER